MEISREIDAALKRGAALFISSSGGKDSEVIAMALLIAYWNRGWKGPLRMVHADTGRSEWSVTLDYVTTRAKELQLPLDIVRRPQGDLLDEMWERHRKRPDAPPFPSSAARYCMADQKRAQIDKLLREYEGEIVCATGVRAEESPARAKKPVWEIRPSLKPTKKRIVYDWRPIFDWKLPKVWDYLGVLHTLELTRREVKALREQGVPSYEAVVKAGWPWHPAYALGNERLSCSICIMGSKNDIMNGIDHNPDYYRELVKLERASGFSFKKNLRLESLRPDLLGE